MPYLNCQRCRLPVYGAVPDVAGTSCPRCGALLAEAPRSLFAAVPNRIPVQRPVHANRHGPFVSLRAGGPEGHDTSTAA